MRAEVGGEQAAWRREKNTARDGGKQLFERGSEGER